MSADQHSHNHHDHDHDQAPKVTNGNERRVLGAMVLTAGFMVAEIAGGILSGSLALIADAGHMATDAAALALAFIAFRLAARPANPNQSYGYHRAETLAAFVNALAMITLVAWIIYEAIMRFFEPHAILGGMMLWVAVGGLIVNIIAFTLLHSGDRENLNMRGAAVHVLGDLLGSVAAIAAAIIIILTGWTPIDPILSVLVALLILRSALSLAKQSGHILMEGTPRGLDLENVRSDIETHVRGVEDVHHIHAWSLTATRNVITLHVRIAGSISGDEILKAIQDRLKERFNIGHATIQVETKACIP
ncbi:MAG: cation diffusion facilitator family transporter [Parvibaculum sp.]